MRVTETNRISLERIAQAADVIDPVFLDSPQFQVEPLEGQLAVGLVVEGRDLTRFESFKGRGTEYLTRRSTGAPSRVHETGNFGQGMAYSAGSTDCPSPFSPRRRNR